MTCCIVRAGTRRSSCPTGAGRGRTERGFASVASGYSVKWTTGCATARYWRGVRLGKSMRKSLTAFRRRCKNTSDMVCRPLWPEPAEKISALWPKKPASWVALCSQTHGSCNCRGPFPVGLESAGSLQFTAQATTVNRPRGYFGHRRPETPCLSHIHARTGDLRKGSARRAMRPYRSGAFFVLGVVTPLSPCTRDDPGGLPAHSPPPARCRGVLS